MKMQFLTSILFLLINSTIVLGQDQESTELGPLNIIPIGHGTVAFTWDSKSVFVDPYGGAEAFADLDDPDVIFITDIHGDHLNLETLEGLETSGAIFIVPQEVANQLPEGMGEKVVVLNNGQESEVEGIGIKAIPMYNLPETADAFHPKGRGNGYVLTMGGKQIYISGDTEDIPEMRSLQDIDVAFVCMNLPYTMEVDQAASAVLDFKPKVVYPYHYRGTEGLSDIDSFKQMVSAENRDIDVRLRAWY